MIKKAALIEIDGSHDECLYSQLLFLKEGGYHTTLICSADLERQVADFEADQKLFLPMAGKGALARFPLLLQLRRHLLQEGIDTVIINSAHGSLVRNLCLLPFPARVRFVGTMHGINKLAGSFGQKLIATRIKKYFLLNDYLLDNLKAVPHAGLRFQSYYPIFFPAFAGMPVVSKPANECWVCIPGQVEYKRRDYETLVHAFAGVQDKGNIRFLLLGRSDHQYGNGQQLKELVASLGLQQYFRFWNGFVDNAVFHAYLAAADVVMPLIHPGNDGFEKYLTFQITGAYNLAFAHRKPLLMLQDFDRYEDFRENALFYTTGNLSSRLQELTRSLAAIQPQLYRNPKFSFGFQAQRYLAFVEEP